MKLIKHGSFVAAPIAVAILFFLGTSVYAASSRPSFTWLQATNSTWTSNQFTSGSGQATFEGVATSPNSGQFTVKLQEKVGGLFWADTSNTYTVNQHSNVTYNTRTGKNVNGQYFKVYWSSKGSTPLRVVLKNPTNPQATVITQVYY